MPSQAMSRVIFRNRLTRGDHHSAAIVPPSAIWVVPVIIDASSDSRNTTMPAISSGAAMRPCSRAIIERAPRAQGPVEHCHGGLLHRGVDECGQQRVGADARRAQFGGGDAAELDDAGLRHAVCAGAAHRYLAR